VLEALLEVLDDDSDEDVEEAAPDSDDDDALPEERDDDAFRGSLVRLSLR